MNQAIYTIGHSNGSVGRLLDLLAQPSITAVADVRSQPYSRFNPQFNREEIAASLKKSNIEYIFLGRELGARSEDPTCYRDGRAQYSLIAKTALFSSGIQGLLDAAEKSRVAIMCAEKEPLECHRAILISRHLHERGFDVRHILEDGRVEDHASLLLRMLAAHGMQESELFRTHDELVAIAYELQAGRIGYIASQASQPA